jgi:hypothetical protein
LQTLSLYISLPLDIFIKDEVDYYMEDHEVPEFVTFGDRVISGLAVAHLSHISLHGFKTTDSLPILLEQASSLEKLELLSIGAGTQDAWQETLKLMRPVHVSHVIDTGSNHVYYVKRWSRNNC